MADSNDSIKVRKYDVQELIERLKADSLMWQGKGFECTIVFEYKKVPYRNTLNGFNKWVYRRGDSSKFQREEAREFSTEGMASYKKLIEDMKSLSGVSFSVSNEHTVYDCHTMPYNEHMGYCMTYGRTIVVTVSDAFAASIHDEAMRFYNLLLSEHREIVSQLAQKIKAFIMSHKQISVRPNERDSIFEVSAKYVIDGSHSSYCKYFYSDFGMVPLKNTEQMTGMAYAIIYDLKEMSYSSQIISISKYEVVVKAEQILEPKVLKEW